MQIDDHLAHVQSQVESAAALGDERTQQIASALGTALVPAVRLAIMGALSTAADEITAALLDVPGAPAVTVALDGADVRIDVRLNDTATDATAATPTDDTDTSARISLRLSELLKTDVEAAARAAGVSVNSWLVRAAMQALAVNARGAQRGGLGAADPRRNAGNSHRVTGWING